MWYNTDQLFSVTVLLIPNYVIMENVTTPCKYVISILLNIAQFSKKNEEMYK